MRHGGRRSDSRARGHTSSPWWSSWGWAILKVLSVAGLSLVCGVMIAYCLPSLKLIYTQLLPRLHQVLTPGNLFLLLNLLIFSIVALAHLHRHQQRGSAPGSLGSTVHHHLHGRHHPHLQSSASASSVSVSASSSLISLSLPSAAADRMEEYMEVDHHHHHHHHHQSVQLGTTHPLQEDPRDANGGDSDDSGGSGSGNSGDHDDIDGDHHHSDTDGGHHYDDNGGGGSSNERGLKMQGEEEESFLDAPSHVNPPTLPSPQEDSPPPHHLSQFRLPNPPFLASIQGPFTPAHDRPLPSARFTHKKQLSRASPSDRSHSPLRISRTSTRSHSPLRISRSPAKRASTTGDTLDATWRAICEKKHGLAPHHYRHHAQLSSRSSSIENPQDTSNVNPSSSSLVETKPHSHSRLRRREPSINREELNKKVESFISRFNQQIRLQRQESLLRYKEMANKDPSNES